MNTVKPKWWSALLAHNKTPNPDIEFIGKTDVGRIRSNNEDTFATNREAGFCLVADGMGGAAAGEMASQLFTRIACQALEDLKSPSEKVLVQCVHNAFHQANESILEHVEAHPEHKGMGCTAELLAFTATRFVIGHIGDSRTYRLRQGVFTQLTKDHSYVQEQLDQGLITVEQARTHKMRNIILRAVGVKPSPALDIVCGSIFAGDLFLLCSDGLTDLVADEQIVEILQADASLDRQAEQLIEKANAYGGKDNVTVVLARVHP
jgi:PPM family protein phosphatase